VPADTTRPTHLIAVDWGTTRFRAYRIDGAGSVCDEVDTPDGILAAAGRFSEVLQRAIAPWRAESPKVPVLMSGMIGARQGWHEAPYVTTPADRATLAENLLAVSADDTGTVHIVPGIATRSAADVPDVMRGEEVQVFGACELMSIADATFVLPGTHAKWVDVAGRRITGFRTFMTGEIFAALKDHTILGRMMEPAPAAPAMPSPGFARGLAAARALPASPGALLHAVFATRTLALFDALAPGDAADYLSGLLIGAEVLSAAPPGRSFVIVGGAALSGRYAAAARELGFTATLAPDRAGVAGLLTVARHAGLVTASVGT
jgi:2-dehydro-3-deoxygalactonokinase